jgi:hypothetical protein
MCWIEEWERTKTESFYGSGQVAVEGPQGRQVVAAAAAAAAVVVVARQRESCGRVTVTQRHGLHVLLSCGRENKVQPVKR